MKASTQRETSQLPGSGTGVPAPGRQLAHVLQTGLVAGKGPLHSAPLRVSPACGSRVEASFEYWMASAAAEGIGKVRGLEAQWANRGVRILSSSVDTKSARVVQDPGVPCRGQISMPNCGRLRSAPSVPADQNMARPLRHGHPLLSLFPASDTTSDSLLLQAPKSLCRLAL